MGVPEGVRWCRAELGDLLLRMLHHLSLVLQRKQGLFCFVKDFFSLCVDGECRSKVWKEAISPHFWETDNKTWHLALMLTLWYFASFQLLTYWKKNISTHSHLSFNNMNRKNKHQNGSRSAEYISSTCYLAVIGCFYLWSPWMRNADWFSSLKTHIISLKL